ncbi:MAG: BRO family protein [Clostridium sp.]
MNDLIIRKFENKNVKSFILDGKLCWLATELAEIFGYNQKAKAIFDCIKREKFNENIEYDILNGKRLKYFKETFSENLGGTKYASKVIIFYEEGLYGFLAYTEMPLGIEFRSWIRREVIPTIRAKGYYTVEATIDDFEVLENEKREKCEVNDVELVKLNLEKLKIANETFRMIENILDNREAERKIVVLDSIYKSIGVEIDLKNYNEEFLDVIQIALELGIYNEAENPNCEAIEEMLKRIDVIESERRYIHREYKNFSETVIKYSSSVLEKIINWIVNNEKPMILSTKEKDIVIIYKF